MVIQGDASTGRAWNGEPRQKEKFKARKAQLRVRGQVKSAKKYTLKFKKFKQIEPLLPVLSH